MSDTIGQEFNEEDTTPVLNVKLEGCIEPVIGLQYITEFHSLDANGKLQMRYTCSICGGKMDIGLIMSHILGVRHRCLTMKENPAYQEMYEDITNKEIKRKRSELSELASNFAMQIEVEEGRQKVRVVRESAPVLPPTKPELCPVMRPQPEPHLFPGMQPVLERPPHADIQLEGQVKEISSQIKAEFHKRGGDIESIIREAMKPRVEGSASHQRTTANQWNHGSDGNQIRKRRWVDDEMMGGNFRGPVTGPTTEMERQYNPTISREFSLGMGDQHGLRVGSVHGPGMGEHGLRVGSVHGPGKGDQHGLRMGSVHGSGIGDEHGLRMGGVHDFERGNDSGFRGDFGRREDDFRSEERRDNRLREGRGWDSNNREDMERDPGWRGEWDNGSRGEDDLRSGIDRDSGWRENREWDSGPRRGRGWDSGPRRGREWDSGQRGGREWDSGSRGEDDLRSGIDRDSGWRENREWDSGPRRGRGWDSGPRRGRGWDSGPKGGREWDSRPNEDRGWDSGQGGGRNNIRNGPVIPSLFDISTDSGGGENREELFRGSDREGGFRGADVENREEQFRRADVENREEQFRRADVENREERFRRADVEEPAVKRRADLSNPVILEYLEEKKRFFQMMDRELGLTNVNTEHEQFLEQNYRPSNRSDHQLERHGCDNEFEMARGGARMRRSVERYDRWGQGMSKY
ncbi:uncharacterized protein LOC141905698 [Tubulanus polymorphus]|uniref:uncharacterized protein LOC141905698 n=1 Tax=Tubulanus polymorphus TaxID=672921 RepID=UPI003DA4CA2F